MKTEVEWVNWTETLIYIVLLFCLKCSIVFLIIFLQQKEAQRVPLYNKVIDVEMCAECMKTSWPKYEAT